MLYLIVSIPDLYALIYFYTFFGGGSAAVDSPFIVAPSAVGGFVLRPGSCCAILSVLSSFAIFSLRASCFSFLVCLMSCWCYRCLALRPHGAVLCDGLQCMIVALPSHFDLLFLLLLILCLLLLAFYVVV